VGGDQEDTNLKLGRLGSWGFEDLYWCGIAALVRTRWLSTKLAVLLLIVWLIIGIVCQSMSKLARQFGKLLTRTVAVVVSMSAFR